MLSKNIGAVNDSFLFTKHCILLPVKLLLACLLLILSTMPKLLTSPARESEEPYFLKITLIVRRSDNTCIEVLAAPEKLPC
jgi:hypothetical protein